MINTCPTCGQDLPSTNRPKGGRPLGYCSTPCRELAARLNQVESLLQTIREYSTEVGTAQLRKRIWTAANTLNRSKR